MLGKTFEYTYRKGSKFYICKVKHYHNGYYKVKLYDGLSRIKKQLNKGSEELYYYLNGVESMIKSEVSRYESVIDRMTIE